MAAWTGCSHPDCGQPHPNGCHGHANVKNEAGEIVGIRPCKRHPVRGANPERPGCPTHGGTAPQTKAAAAAGVAEGHAVARLNALDVKPTVNPLEQLQLLCAKAYTEHVMPGQAAEAGERLSRALFG